MKKKPWIMFLIIMAVLLGILVFCLTQIRSTDSLMRPPDPVGQNEEISDAFYALKEKSNIQLEAPVSGEYNSAFVKYDVDGDAYEEVLAFYTDTSKEDRVRISLIDYDETDGTWSTVYDSAGYGTYIDSVDFADFNGDGINEIILSWGLYTNSISKVLTVHETSFTDEDTAELTTLLNQTYYFKTVADMTNDDTEELLVIWPSTGSNGTTVYAGLFKMSDKGNLDQLGTRTPVDSNISGYGNYHLQETGSHTIMLLDAYKGDEGMITEVLYWNTDRERLMAPLTDRDTLTNSGTFRIPAIPSADSDGDGLYEIPVVSGESVFLNDESETENDNYAVNLTTWYGYTYGVGLVAKHSGFISQSNNCYFRMSSGAASQILMDYQNILVYLQESTGVLTFYSTEDGSTTEEVLFSLVPSTPSKMTGEESYTFRKDSEDSEHTVYGTITTAGKNAGFTDEIIEHAIYFYETS